MIDISNFFQQNRMNLQAIFTPARFEFFFCILLFSGHLVYVIDDIHPPKQTTRKQIKQIIVLTMTERRTKKFLLGHIMFHNVCRSFRISYGWLKMKTQLHEQEYVLCI